MNRVQGLTFLLILVLLTTRSFAEDNDADTQGNEVDSSPGDGEFPADDAYWPKEGQDWMEGVPTARIQAPHRTVQ